MVWTYECWTYIGKYSSIYFKILFDGIYLGILINKQMMQYL